MIGKSTLNTGSIYLTSRLTLQVFVSADMIGIGVCIVDRRQFPIVLIQNSAYLASCVFIVSAVDQTHLVVVQFDKTDLRGTLYVIAMV